MAGNYAVRVVLMTSGERLPMLFNLGSGLPLFAPTIYTLTEHRQRSLASNTIERVLRELEVLLTFLDAREICLDERMRVGQLLSLAEIDGLVRQCGLHASEFEAHNQKLDEGASNRAFSVTQLERFRMRSSPIPPKGISTDTASNRIRTIQAYLSWLIRLHLSRQDIGTAVGAELASTQQFVLTSLAARIPDKKGRNIVGLREGASPEVLSLLLEVINPVSPANPWLQ